jgi:voltage-gated potassium channel Kch
MKRASLRDRLRYAFDNFMSRGTIALIGGLGVLSLVVILVAALILSTTGVHPEDSGPLGFFEAAWASLMRTLDAGTMGSDTGWGFRLIMFGVTLGGVFIISTLIGVLTSGIESKLDELRKGRSRVIEEGHTVILGWSEQVFTLVSELAIANANQRHPVIVIMGEKDKVEMEDEIRARVGDTGRTRVVCRTGNPMEPTDLELVSLHTARSIIVLATDEEEPDSQVIKTILAIVNHPHRRPEPYHIVAAIRDPRNWEVAKMVGQDEVELVLAHDLIARIIAQTCRQSGLSAVYTELLDFGGDEIYFASEPGLTGRTFGEALLAYEDSALIGLCKNGTPLLNPPMETLIEPGDQVIAISEDDDTVRLSGRSDLGIDESAIQTPPQAPAGPERTLILGWNQRAPAILSELDRYVPPGSEVTVAASHIAGAVEVAGLRNQTVSLHEAETTDRQALENLRVGTYDRVIVLCYDGLDPQRADARTLITLLHLRDIAEHSDHRFSIVSEMLDVRNRDLAEATHADDFIVSDRLVSLMMAQISENKALNAVLSDIFDPEGSEIYLKPATYYVKAGVPVNFYTVVEAARRRGQVAIGYRLLAHANDAERSYGIVINPDKSGVITFTEQDRIIVVAEE